MDELRRPATHFLALEGELPGRLPRGVVSGGVSLRWGQFRSFGIRAFLLIALIPSVLVDFLPPTHFPSPDPGRPTTARFEPDEARAGPAPADVGVGIPDPDFVSTAEIGFLADGAESSVFIDGWSDSTAPLGGIPPAGGRWESAAPGYLSSPAMGYDAAGKMLPGSSAGAFTPPSSTVVGELSGMPTGGRFRGDAGLDFPAPPPDLPPSAAPDGVDGGRVGGNFADGDFAGSPNTVPEPAPLLLSAFGLVLIPRRRR